MPAMPMKPPWLANPVDFALAGQGDYSLPLSVVVAGLLDYLSGPSARIWVLDLGLDPAARPRVETVCRRTSSEVQLHWLPVETAQLRGLRTVDHLVPATYARLLLPTLLPHEVTTVVYLDADMLVRADLMPLAALDLGTTPFAAVQDYLVEQIGGDRSSITELTEHPPQEKYFNGGVLVLNLPVWRSSGLAEAAFEFAARHDPLKYGDQDALNAVAFGWRELTPEWNVQSRLFYLDEAAPTEFVARVRPGRESLSHEAKIMHYSGPQKPWDPWCRHPMAGLWARALLHSGALSGIDLARWALSFYSRRAAALSAISAIRVIRKARIRFAAAAGERRSP